MEKIAAMELNKDLGKLFKKYAKVLTDKLLRPEVQLFLLNPFPEQTDELFKRLPLLHIFSFKQWHFFFIK